MLSPKQIEERINKMLNAWRTIAPDKKFAGLTLDEFAAIAAPSIAKRKRIDELDNEVAQVKVERDQADEVFNDKAQQVVAGVLADPEFGPNSALYQGFGYTRKDDRKSGLHRTKHKEPETK
jgi:hypothetical protein